MSLMENIYQKLLSLNDSLRRLNLESGEEKGATSSDNILIRKVMATKVYRRFTIAKIVTKIWRFRRPVKVDKLEDNIFKFQFVSKANRDHFYQIRPRSLDGANLILKLWPYNKVLKEIPFDTTTLWLQIHGLPPAIIHKGTAKKIKSRVSLLHMETMNRRCVVAHRFLQVHVDISLKNPIPTIFSMSEQMMMNSRFSSSMKGYQIFG